MHRGIFFEPGVEVFVLCWQRDVGARRLTRGTEPIDDGTKGLGGIREVLADGLNDKTVLRAFGSVVCESANLVTEIQALPDVLRAGSQKTRQSRRLVLT